MPLHKQLMLVVWPAFLAACVLELLVFALVDPLELRWAGQALELSRQAAYTFAFFAFWAVSAGSCALTVILGWPMAPDSASPGSAGG